MRLAIVVVLGLAVVSSSAPHAQAPDMFSTLAARVSKPPRPLIAAGRFYLAYEIHLTNIAARATTIDSIEVRESGRPENPPLLRRAVPITPATLGGNFVILDLGHGVAAFYAHLQPGRLLVKKGDRVPRGQPIGLVGNSGNSSEPHLHFHLSEGNASFDAEGIPYVFSSFEEEATADDVTHAMKEDGNSIAIDAAALREWSARPPAQRRREMLLSSTLVRFAAR